MGKVFHLVILQLLYNLGRLNIDHRLRVQGVECVLTLKLIVSMRTHTDTSCKAVMYELLVVILINSATLINIIVR